MPAPDRHPLVGRDVVVAADGTPVRLHVIDHGSAGLVPVLLLHGATTTSYVWRGVVRDLEHHVRCLAPDLVGLGASERPPARQAYSLDAQARVMLALLEAMGVGRAVVCGLGVGGSVAVHLAALAPERVAGLVLVGTGIHPVPLPAPRRALRWWHAALRDRPPANELRHNLTYVRGLPRARAGLRLLQSHDAAPVEAAWRMVWVQPPPALLLWGAEDRLVPVAVGQQLADELPGAAFVPVPGAGHLLPLHRPERVAEEIAGLAAELG